MIKLLLPYPAALVKAQETRTLVIADLHIGWEIALAEKGIHVPPQMPKLLNKLTTIISQYKPDRLLVLGDIKYTVSATEMGEWQDIPNFFSELKKHVKEISIIRGNHDGNLEPLLPEGISILPSTGIALGEVGFFHGHQWPSPTLLQCKILVMGHVHPVIALSDPAGFRIVRQVWVRIDCDKAKLAQVLLQKHEVKIEGASEKTLQTRYKIRSKASKLFIMPSFNDFLGGKPLNEKKRGETAKNGAIGPVLRSEAIDMKAAEIYLLDGIFLGTLNQLESLS